MHSCIVVTKHVKVAWALLNDLMGIKTYGVITVSGYLPTWSQRVFAAAIIVGQSCICACPFFRRDIRDLQAIP